MGAGQSKEEALYQAAQNSNHQAVKTLRRDGASLEWLDKEGRTPLVLACTRGDLYDMVITLLNEGANLNVYRQGPHGGYPLHHAAKRGLDKTVLLLLSRGANPLAVNDDNMTPLDMARNKSHLNVVRIIEERMCLFSGTMRELSGPGFIEYWVPHMVTKKIWVVVLPTEPDPRRPARNEVVIYPSSKVAIPRTVISLAKADVEEPKFHHRDPALVITAMDKSAKVKFKFLSENEGDKAQLERFYKACQGIRQSEGGVPPSTTILPPPQGLQALTRPPAPHAPGAIAPPNSSSINPTSQPNPPPSISPTVSTSIPKPKPSNSSSPAPAAVAPPSEPIPDEIALALAIKNSIISASAEGVPVSPSARQPTNWDNKWGPFDGRNGEKNEYAGWADGEQSSYGGWDSGPSAGVGPSRLGPSAAENPSSSESKHGSTKPFPSPPKSTTHSPGTSGLNPGSGQSIALSASISTSPAPSAPPLPLDGPIRYPSINTSPAQVNYGGPPSSTSDGPAAEKNREDKSSGQCVVCWDATAEAVCIPCGHLSGCMDCLTEIKSKEWGCPVCRAPIDQVLKVYAV